VRHPVRYVPAGIVYPGARSRPAEGPVAPGAPDGPAGPGDKWKIGAWRKNRRRF